MYEPCDGLESCANENRPIRLLPLNIWWSMRTSDCLRLCWLGEVAMKLREVDSVLPTLASGINATYFRIAGSSRSCGMMLFGKGFEVTIPLALSTRDCGS